MAYLRKLPSGRWQATVRHPSGRRISRTDPLRRVVAEWARELEAQLARGDLRDPRAGKISVGDWYERWIAARGVVAATKVKLASAWRTHCQPQWGRWPMDAITRMEAQEWVRVLERKRRARHRGRPAGDDSPEIAAATVHTAVHLMSALFVAAVEETPPIVVSNPFAKLDLPTVPPGPIVFYEHDEADALIAALDRLGPPQYAVLVEAGLWVGLREGELFGLSGERVDWLRARAEVTRVMTRTGLRDYPKSRKSHRVVPVRAVTLGRMSALMVGRAREALVFTTAQGHPIRDETFRHRIWYPAVKAAGVRPLPPRAMRHTAASWLVQDGVPLYDVQALLGHESYRTTERYAHLAPDTHGKVIDSWRRADDARATRKDRRDRLA